MIASQTDMGVLQDVAVRLYYSLHSAENENIISSLLTAALDESEEFRKWFLNRSGMDKRYQSANFYAESNTYLPMGLAGKRKGRYGFADACLLHVDVGSKWESLKDRSRAGEWESAREDLRAVFVEVKHTSLTLKDRTKYTRFHRLIGRVCHERRVRFVIVSSHTKRALEHLHDREWKEMIKALRTDSELSQHILLSEILGAVRLHKKSSDNILQVFETYLSLILGMSRDESILTRLWVDIVRDCSSYSEGECVKSLKREVIEHIERLAAVNAFSDGRWPRKDEGIISLKTISLDRDKSKITNISGGNVKELAVEIDGERELFVFELRKQPDIETIVHNLMEISRLISSDD